MTLEKSLRPTSSRPCHFSMFRTRTSRIALTSKASARMTKKWIDRGKLRWCWLEIGEAALMLEEFRREGHNRSKPNSKVGEGVAICFMCLRRPGDLSPSDLTRAYGQEPFHWKRPVGCVFLGSGWLSSRFRKPYGCPRGEGVSIGAQVTRDLPWV
jgi:hypothetical protein